MKTFNQYNHYITINKRYKLNPQNIAYLAQEDFTRKKIANFANRSERTIYRWNKPNTKILQKIGRKPKAGIKEIELLISYVENNNTVTQKEMANYLSQKLGQPISRQTIGLILKKHQITRKKITYHYADQLNQTDKINKFKVMTTLLPKPRVFALDECSFHLNEAPRYGYSYKSSRAVSQRPGKQGFNYTLILCIQNIVKGGVVKYQLIEKGAKTKNFHEFLETIVLPSNQKNYLILDNARIHHATKSCQKLGLSTIKELSISKNIELTYLPPYTPELNPVELCFNFIRQKIEKNKPRTFEELQLAITKINLILKKKDLTQYFRHAFNYDISF